MLLFIGCSNPEPKRSTPSEYASVKSLAEVEDLTSSGAQWKLIDLRKPEEFKQGHIPGAQNVWRTDITDTTYSYGGMMPSQLHMEQLLSKLGIAPKDTIVIYDYKAECDAARLWWILKFYGHQNTKLLNGGLKAWIDSDGQISHSDTKSSSTDYRFESLPDSSIHATMSFVQSSIGNAEIILLDTRGEQEFDGKLKDGAARGGHINYALNFDWARSVDYDGTMKFLPSDTLKARYAAIGIDGSKPVVTYCHSGVRSAHTLYVLTELLGYRNIKNYDGSWIEWSHIRAE